MLKKIISIGIADDISDERKFQLKIRNSLAIAIILTISTYISLHVLFQDDYTIFITYIAYYSIAFSLLYAHYKRKFIVGEYIICIAIPLAFLLSCLFLGEQYHVEYLLLVSGIGSCYMFEPLDNRDKIRKYIILFHFVLFISIKVYYLYLPHGILTLDPRITFVFNLFNSFSAFAAVYSMVSSSFHFRENLYDKLQELSDHQEHIIQERTKEIRRFSYISAHDLREPLRNIKGFSQLLHRDVKAGKQENIEEYLGFIDKGIRKMDTLTKDIVNYTELEHHIDRIQQVNTHQVVTTIFDNYSTHSKKIEFDCEALPVIPISEKLCSLLFSNLIDNAIIYNDKPIPKVKVSCKVIDNQYQFAVEDNGVGILPTYHDTIFVLFKRLQKEVETTSSGIGLAICKKILTAYQGKIWIESNVEKGSVFYFTLPISSL